MTTAYTALAWRCMIKIVQGVYETSW